MAKIITINTIYKAIIITTNNTIIIIINNRTMSRITYKIIKINTMMRIFNSVVIRVQSSNKITVKHT